MDKRKYVAFNVHLAIIAFCIVDSDLRTGNTSGMALRSGKAAGISCCDL